MRYFNLHLDFSKAYFQENLDNLRPEGNIQQTIPEHILECLDLSRNDVSQQFKNFFHYFMA